VDSETGLRDRGREHHPSLSSGIGLERAVLEVWGKASVELDHVGAHALELLGDPSDLARTGKKDEDVAALLVEGAADRPRNDAFQRRA
jgi:hypothetical protein